MALRFSRPVISSHSATIACSSVMRGIPLPSRVLAGQEAAAAFLDPPYNVPARNIGGRGQHQHEDFAFASGEMSRPQS